MFPCTPREMSEQEEIYFILKDGFAAILCEMSNKQSPIFFLPQWEDHTIVFFNKLTTNLLYYKFSNSGLYHYLNTGFYIINIT